jgi:predicted DNA-binding protein
MSSQRTSPASFSRLKEVLPATQPQTTPPTSIVAEPKPVATAAPAPAAAPVEPVPPPIAVQQPPVQPAYVPPPPPRVATAPTQTPVVQPSAVQHQAIRPSRSALAARPGKRLQHTKPATFRLPIELIETLKDVAHHNNLNMTDIVAEAVWLHLDSFEWPNGLEATRELLAAHFAAPARR